MQIYTYCFLETIKRVKDWHEDVIKWKHFPRYWTFARGIHQSPVNSPHKGQCAELWYFLWSAPEQPVEETIETPGFKTPSRSLWRHCYGLSALRTRRRQHIRRLLQDQGLDSLRRCHLIGIGILILNMRPSSDGLGFISTDGVFLVNGGQGPWEKTGNVILIQNCRHFANSFSCMKIAVFYKILFPRIQLIIIQYWFRQWFGTDKVTNKPSSS